MTREHSKTLFLCALLGAFILTFVMLPPGTLSLEGIKTHQQALLSHVDHAPLQRADLFALYVAVSALSIPGAAILTLLGGTLFPLWEGTVLVSFASTLGPRWRCSPAVICFATGFSGGLPSR
jgi:uncharacterized membrane protein YdjX (TVP38/TMEM64 family)